MSQTQGPRAVERTAWPEKVALGALVVLFFEVAITGSGQILRLGPITFRNLLILTVFLLMLPRVLRSWRWLASNCQVRITALFGVFLVGSAVAGMVQGNRTSAIATDLTTLVALILVPSVSVLITNREHLARLVGGFVLGSFCLALVTAAVHFAGAFGLVNSNNLAIFADKHQLGTVSNVGGMVIRMYLRSFVVMVLALPLAIYAVATKRRPRLMLVVASFLALALLASLTRSLLLGGIVSCLLALLLSRATAISWRAAIQAGLGLLLLVGLSTAAYQRPVLLEALGLRMAATIEAGETPSSSTSSRPPTRGPSASPSKGSSAEPSGSATTRQDKPEDTSGEQASQDLRDRTWAAQWKLFKQRPILGWGLGKGIPEIRDDPRTEFMFLDYGVKIGVVGTLLFLLTFFAVPFAQLWSNLRCRAQPKAGFAVAVQAIATCALVGFAASSLMNPFLNNSIGVSVLLLALAAGALADRAETAPEESRTGSPGATDAPNG